MHEQVYWNELDRGVVGRWGATTSSLNWCEGDYQYTPYLAEAINCTSNLIFLTLAGFGIWRCVEERLPKRCIAAYVGLVLVGTGSALFHATLKYEMQLLDELPMIAVSTLVTWLVMDVSPLQSRSLFTTSLPYLLVLFNIGFTYAYLQAPNPVFHQVAFGCLVTATTARGAQLLFTRLLDTPSNVRKNSEVRQIQVIGVVSFLVAFALWNVDNLLCSHLTFLKSTLGSPSAWLFEAHAYWHLLTGVGVYAIVVSNTFLTLAIRDHPDNYEFIWQWGVLPYVSRTRRGWASLGVVRMLTPELYDEKSD